MHHESKAVSAKRAGSQRNRLSTRRFVLGGVILPALMEASANAQPQTSDDASTADQRFRAGVAAYQQKDPAGAVRHFEAAYGASPHASVLYNLGLAYGASGRPVEAIETLSRYLEELGDKVPRDRREQVESAIRRFESWTATLELVISPQDSEVLVDGRRLDRAKIAGPLRLVAGSHTLLVRSTGKQSEARRIDLAAGAHERLDIALDDSPVSPAPSSWAVLLPSCGVPEARVLLNGEPLLADRVAGAIPVMPGSHSLRWTRDGYAGAERRISIGPGQFQSVACDLRVRDDLDLRLMARVVVTSSQPDAVVWLDGAKYEGGLVPAGQHHLALDCPGCVLWSTDVVLAPGERRTLAIEPEMTAAARRHMNAHRTQRRTWALATGTLGVALGVSAAILFASYRDRSAAWTERRDALRQELASTPGEPTILNAAFAHDHEALSIQQLQDFAVGTAAGSALALATAGVLYFVNPSSLAHPVAATSRPGMPGAMFTW